ncbi:E3 ubiquitin-protein ligase HOS1-like [Tripterygium wilfordii]|uniref:E3 ubiquitin-protein ligase HOS1-like n=1 Tax=Tripterygium wilfordii TaxID=458696 RepID=A0A7J7CK00_TRIWF|nr:E3 ubiquitin-protein ligase HOS1-like [Tripterygium wilfordii]KAF5734397.1 E3 ubiquitin-protein ligase HOS1-like [Tripterygium wilfordii]
MERKGMNGTMSPWSSADSGANPRSAPPPPDYSNPAVQDALEHLASIDLIDLCKEAKVERCRATRDLRSCGRDVKDVLNSCGHASLCAECSQRCDVCPICRIPIPKTSDRLRLRLYYECIQAGLISRRLEERFQETEDLENESIADVERLYSIFDVALENGLTSLICHYVTDVCMDENAVSSDPVIAFLLDEVVVKDWCKLTFRSIIKELQQIYNLEVEEMNSRLSSLLKFSVHLAGISNILEVLGASFKNSISAKLDDLQHLHESILKTKQHIEIMMWCIRHHFLENVRSRYTNFESWESLVRERKSAAIKRSWYDAVSHAEEPDRREGSLFIEDALVNLEVDLGHVQEMGEESALAVLQKDGDSLFLRSQIEGVSGCYPFENLRAAVDILFLHGSSDLVIAKQAIFLYYLFDRHYTLQDEEWRDIVDDFAANFGVSRHFLLESFAFYLLDDHTDKALQEACDILPEICGPATHPKIAQVLLERHMPETALMVLRWSGRDGGSQLVTLDEAVTGVRLRVECGLLTEAFMHQRMLCTKVREMKLKYASSGDPSNELKDGSRSWLEWMNILVTEICCLCIRRNLVDRIIEMPWNSEEEKYLHECLLNHAIDDPSTTTGSLLVVFYLQRYRYVEACQVDRKLQSVEQDFISRNSATEIVSRMTSVIHWRAGLVDKCMKLLPEVQEHQVNAGESTGVDVDYGKVPVTSALSEPQEPKPSSLLIPSSNHSSLILRGDHTTSLKLSSSASPIRQHLPVSNPLELRSSGSPSILYERLFTDEERGLKNEVGIGNNFMNNEMSTPGLKRFSPVNVTPFADIKKSSSRVLPSSKFRGIPFDKRSPSVEEPGSQSKFQSTSTPYPRRVVANLASTPSSNNGLLKDSARPNASSKKVQLDKDDRRWNVVPADDATDISWSYGEKGSAGEDGNANGGPRWRSDETSDEEEAQSLERAIGVASHTTPRSRTRRRFARR